MLFTVKFFNGINEPRAPSSGDWVGQNPDQTPEGARGSLTEIIQLCTCFFCVCFLILMTFLGYAASLKVVYFSSGQRLEINPNFKIMLSYWSTFKSGFLQTHMTRKSDFYILTFLYLRSVSI